VRVPSEPEVSDDGPRLPFELTGEDVPCWAPATGSAPALVFVASMVVGMGLFHAYQLLLKRREQPMSPARA
jgi:hypothetical protein